MPKVLVIDDEQSTVELLQVYLSMKGFEVVSAYLGRDGLALAQIESPDAVLLDMMLPDMSGDMICKHLRTSPATAHLPIIMLSAGTEKAIQDRSMAAGANGCMTKPVKFPELLKQLNALLTPPAVAKQ